MDDTEKLHFHASRVANEFAKAYNKKHKLQIPLPVVVKMDLELTGIRHARAAGTASGNTISLNTTMFRENKSTFFNVVIPHEVAHLAQMVNPMTARFPNAAKGHSWLWVDMMETMSQKPLQFHTMSSLSSVEAYKANQKKIKAEQAAKKKKKKVDQDEEQILLIPLD